jgi:hypothetical protein
MTLPAGTKSKGAGESALAPGSARRNYSRMPSGPRITAARAVAIAAVCGAWAMSCSADVNGYHFATDTLGTGNVASGSGAQSSGGASSGGFMMVAPMGGAGGSSGGVGGGSGAGGAGGGGTPGTGGAGGVPSTGGIPSSGGIPSTGGVPNTGGAPGDPVQVTLTPQPSGITAASWRPDLTPPRFYLLEAGMNRFWSLNPATGAVSGPLALPTGSVVPRAFGTSAGFAYVVIGNAINRVPIGGSTTATAVLPITLGGAALTVTGAYAAGWFLVGQTSGATYALYDTASALDSGAGSLTNVNRVVTDGKSFAFRNLVVNTAEAHLIGASSPFKALQTPCAAGTAANLGDPLGVSGNTVAWIICGGTSCQLHFATVSGGVCTPGSSVAVGMSGASARFVGLIDDQYALVLPNVFGTSADVQIIKAGGGFSSKILAGVSLGSKAAYMFVMGPPHYAVVLSDDFPAVISF